MNCYIHSANAMMAAKTQGRIIGAASIVAYKYVDCCLRATLHFHHRTKFSYLCSDLSRSLHRTPPQSGQSEVSLKDVQWSGVSGISRTCYQSAVPRNVNFPRWRRSIRYPSCKIPFSTVLGRLTCADTPYYFLSECLRSVGSLLAFFLPREIANDLLVQLAYLSFRMIAVLSVRS